MFEKRRCHVFDVGTGKIAQRPVFPPSSSLRIIIKREKCHQLSFSLSFSTGGMDKNDRSSSYKKTDINYVSF